MASQVPPTLKSINGYVKFANDNAERDPVIYYWCLFYAVQEAIKIDKTSNEALQFIKGVLSTLEVVKKQFSTMEAITTNIVAQAHIENYALKLFNYADSKEKNGQADKSTFRAFYNAALLFDTLALFGEIDENIVSMKKYAKYTSAQIGKCLRDGTPYVSSSAAKQDDLSFMPPNDQESQFNNSTNIGFHDDINAFGLPPVPQQGSNDYMSIQGFNSQPHSTPSPHVPPPNTSSFPSPLAAPRTQPNVIDNAPPPSYTAVPSSGLRQPTSQDYIEARKFTKYALSAIDYEDTKAVVENLKKALSFME